MVTPCSEDPAQSQKTAGRDAGAGQVLLELKEAESDMRVLKEQIGLHTGCFFYFNLRILLLLLDVNV